MTRTALILCLLFLAGSPCGAHELGGLWSVDGTLPDGTRYEALAALSPQKGGGYRLQARGSTAADQLVTWRAEAIREGDLLRVRHLGRRGLASRILGPRTGDPPPIRGEYTIAADGSAFAGRFRLEGSETPGEVRYRRQAGPQVRFEPARLRVRAGEVARARIVSEPPHAARLLWIRGEGVARTYWEHGQRWVECSTLARGAQRIGARLGPAGGAVVAELQLEVDPGVLDQVVARVEAGVAAGEQPIVIFDLDDTLFDTRYRTRELLRAYGEAEGEERLRRLSVRQVRYLLEDTLAAAGFSASELEGAAVKAIRRAWSRGFFQGASYALDRPLRGARDYVERVREAGARVVYLTGRRESTREPSLTALIDGGFPAETIYLKPPRRAGQPRESTEAYKERITRALLQEGAVLAAFDNEPANCNAFRRVLGPDAAVVWLDTRYKPDAPPIEAGIETVTGFR